MHMMSNNNGKLTLFKNVTVCGNVVGVTTRECERRICHNFYHQTRKNTNTFLCKSEFIHEVFYYMYSGYCFQHSSPSLILSVSPESTILLVEFSLEIGPLIMMTQIL